MPPRPRTTFGAAAFVVASGLAACASPPVEVRSDFVDRTSSRARPASATTQPPSAVQACAATVTGIVDLRRSPEVLGAVGGRVVKAPADSGPWLKSIVGGLGTRGFSVSFAPESRGPSDAKISVTIALRSAWVTNLSSDKVANVVLHVRAERSGRTPVDRDFRGAVTAVNWVNSAGELQALVDRAFSRALDDIAGAIHPLCDS